MAKVPPTARSMWFGAALFLAGAAGTWHIRADGEETGALRFGGRQLQVIYRSSDPESFAAWCSFFLVSTVVCAVFAVVCVALAWHIRRQYKH